MEFERERLNEMDTADREESRWREGGRERERLEQQKKNKKHNN